MNRVLVTAFVLVASIAARGEADVWHRALDPKASDELADSVYEREMREGDEHVNLANGHSTSLRLVREQVQAALTSYHNAALARPARAEPYLRIGDLIYSFYLENCHDQPHFGITPSPLLDCSRPDAIDVRMAEQAIDAWNAAEAREPLHPRFSFDIGESLLFSRAILHTKIATKEHLAKAVVDYEKILERSDGTGGERMDRVWANLAETQMMLGDLDGAIASYREAWRVGATTSTAYGLAVALDRDGREAAAKAWVARQGRGSYIHFRENVASQITFFVPRGEVNYYYALIEETWDNDDAAIAYWREFIASGAHPQFQPRAKVHLDALIAKRRAAGRPIPPRDPFMDMR